MKPFKSASRVILATVILLTLTPVFSSGNQSLLPVSVCNSALESDQGQGTGSASKSLGTDVVRPTWIDLTSPSQVGLLQTPKFPQPFALPLECLWIFNLTEISQTRRNFLHLYFTQFYLEDNIVKVTSLRTSWPLSGGKGDVFNWTDIDSLHGDPSTLEGWTSAQHFGENHGQMQSVEGETYILLRMRANSTSYDRLHKRVLEVDDVYGFNITYELLPSPKERSDACTIGLCNFNGECFLHFNSTTNTVGDFFCQCAFPKYAPSRNREFAGDRCEYHADNDECTKEKNPCQNGGKCRYQSSRYIDCQCEGTGFEGQRCERKVKPSPSPSNKFSSNSSSSCPRHYIQVEVDPANLNEVYYFLRKNVGFPNHNVQVYKSFVEKVKATGKIPPIIRGLISFKWEDEITPNSIKFLKETLRNLARNLADSRIPASQRIYDELGTMNIQTPSNFCTKVIHNPNEFSRDVFVNGEFSLTCKIYGASSPVVLWFKDEIYYINSTFAQVPDRITEDTRMVEGTVGDYYSILFVKDTNELDSGKFSCKVFDVGNESWVPEALFQNEYPSTEAHINVEVVLRPKIDVYPASTTLVKNQESSDMWHRHSGGHNSLYCFAHPTVNMEVAKHYRYEWWKNVNGKNEKITPSTNQALIEYQEEMIMPLGSALTLGKIERDTVYKCRVYNERDTQVNISEWQHSLLTPHTSAYSEKLYTEIEIPVYVAEKLSDTCGDTYKGGILWPRTKKGNTSITQCVLGQGFEAYKCNPTSPHSRPTWNQHVNVSDCVRKPFLKWEKDVDLILSGYVKNSTEDVQLVKKLFRILPDLPGSQAPGMREWQIVLSLLRKALQYAGSKSLPLNYTSMAENFYSQSLSSLSSWGRGLNPDELGPSKAVKIFQILNLIKQSVSIFGNKMDMGQNQEVILASHGHRQINPCLQGLILVKFARLTLPLNPSSSNTWIKRHDVNSGGTDSSANGGTGGYNGNYNLHKCNGMTSVNISIKTHLGNSMEQMGKWEKSQGKSSINQPSPSKTTVAPNNAVVGIVHYKDLEDALTQKSKKQLVTIGNRTLEVTRVSTIVSVIFEDFSSSNVDLKVSIKFYDFALPSNGSSGSLTCASAKIPENPSQDNILKDSLWNLTDSDCKLERNYSNFAGNGNTGIITCICNKPGTFAIIDHKTVDSNEDSDATAEEDNEYIIILSCGCSLTLCLLTLMILLWHFMENKCGITLMHAQVTFMLALLMIIIILKIAKFLHKSYHGEISLCLHYFLSSSLLCQINIPAALFSEVAWQCCYKEFKAFLIVLSFLIPALYTGIVAHLQPPECSLYPMKIDWFVHWADKKQFDAFLSMNLILITVYLSLSYFLVRTLKEKTIKKHESITLMQRSGLITTVIIILECSLLYYANASTTLSTQFILAIPCAAMGGIVFWCHVVGGKPGEEEYTSKFPMMSIESIVGGQGSCSTSTNSGRSSFKDWRDPRLSTTETTVLNPDHSEQSPALQNNNYPTPTTDGHSVESGSTSSVRSRTNKRTHFTSTLKPKSNNKSQNKQISMKSVLDKSSQLSEQFGLNSHATSTPVQNSQREAVEYKPETVLLNGGPDMDDQRHLADHSEMDRMPMTPVKVPCRLRSDSLFDECDKKAEPLQSLLNPLVGSQDPIIDAFLSITKVDIHQISSQPSTASSQQSSAPTTATSCTDLSTHRFAELKATPPVIHPDNQTGSKVVKNSLIKPDEYVLMINNNANPISSINATNVPFVQSNVGPAEPGVTGGPTTASPIFVP